jgi:hypothetical protein
MSVALTPANLLAGLRRARSGPPTSLPDALQALHLNPLTGGRQNAVYLWTPPDGPEAVIKLYYKTDDRRRLDGNGQPSPCSPHTASETCRTRFGLTRIRLSRPSA